MGIVLDLSITRSDLKSYQWKILSVLRDSHVPLSPREIWLKVNVEVAEAVSRSKVIYFLGSAVDDGVIDLIEDFEIGVRYYFTGFRTSTPMPRKKT